MPPDYQALVYGPVYAAWGVAAALVSSDGGTSYPVSAIDLTAGAQLGPDLELQTEVPAACVRASELATLGVDPLALDLMQLQLNGKSWLVTSHRPLPSPLGESDGEYQLLLSDISDIVIGPGGAGSVPVGGYTITVNGNGDLVIVAPDGTTTPLVVKT